MNLSIINAKDFAKFFHTNNDNNDNSNTNNDNNDKKNDKRLLVNCIIGNCLVTHRYGSKNKLFIIGDEDVVDLDTVETGEQLTKYIIKGCRSTDEKRKCQIDKYHRLGDMDGVKRKTCWKNTKKRDKMRCIDFYALKMCGNDIEKARVLKNKLLVAILVKLISSRDIVFENGNIVAVNGLDVISFLNRPTETRT